MALLERYRTLVDWAEAVQCGGLRVSVVQRFGRDVEIGRKDVRYIFVSDPSWKNGSLFDRATRMNAAILAAHPTLIHVNGLQFARQAVRLKRRRSHTPILLQDHASPMPRHYLNRWTLGQALRRLDAVGFVSRDQAVPWVDAGLLRRNQTVYELMEGSTHFRLTSRAEARAVTGLGGSPLCLWVGRLDSNKDPLTVLRGFAKAVPSLPDARLAMIYGSTDLLPSIEAWLAANPAVAGRVQLLGQRPHADLEAVYNSADFFLLGSHHEGSGYAVLEALACGVTPIVTAIPSFRVLTDNGRVGGLWNCGDSNALAELIVARQAAVSEETRRCVRGYFEGNFCWDVIGQRAVGVYRSLKERYPTAPSARE